MIAKKTASTETESPTVLTDTKTLRKQARAGLQQGAVTAGYSADRTKVLELLNASLATELVCVLRYRRHHFMATGINSKAIADEFIEHSNQELGHADVIAKRIVQLGGEPNFSPDELTKYSHAEYVECETLVDMIKENVVAERIAIDSYREFIRYLGNDDPSTSLMLNRILAVEEEHADEMADFLANMSR